MNKLIYILLLIFFNISVFSQKEETVSAKNQRKLQKESRNAEKDSIRNKTLEITRNMIQNKSFVLEANQLSGRSGIPFPVSSTINFVSIDSNICVIQLASNSGLGSNGLGGVTTEGRISSYKIHENKKGGGFTISVLTNTSLGAFDLVFFIDSEGNAQADVTQSTTGVVRTYHGRIVPLEQSKVYKGRSI